MVVAMTVKNKSAPERDVPVKPEYNLLQGYFDQDFDSEFLMTQLETEADRATRAFEQINQHTPPKGKFGRFLHWLSNLVLGS